MIRIKKSAIPPAVLLRRGRRAAARLDAAVAAGRSDLTFDGAIYGHPTVKAQLIADQHGKCCFCESKVGADGDVEHFRPKAGWCQEPGATLNKPGYYRLAYDWSNLLLCCSACNQRFKRTLFPLTNPETRANAPGDDLSAEDLLFINPAVRDSADYIAFRKEIAYAIDDIPVGKATIEALGLNREIFNERRRDRLALLGALHNVVRLLEAKGALTASERRDLAGAKRILANALDDAAEFAALSRCARLADFRIDLP